MRYTTQHPLRVVTLCSGYDSQCLALDRLKRDFPGFGYELVESINPTRKNATDRMKISRQWAMPSMHTFTIQPIRELLKRYVADGKGWIDPFAGENSPAEITNDLNPDKPTKYHMHALDFAKMLDGQYNGCLFDPPYSLRQVKECYDAIGSNEFMANDSNHFPYDIKREIARKIKAGGVVICCGWNSGGFGKKLGFEMVEILLVPHGGMHNDTIVTVERKQPILF